LGIGAIFSNDYINTSQTNTNFNKMEEECDSDVDEAEFSNNSIDNIDIDIRNSNFKCIGVSSFYSETLVDKIYSIAFNILDVVLDGMVSYII